MRAFVVAAVVSAVLASDPTAATSGAAAPATLAMRGGFFMMGGDAGTPGFRLAAVPHRVRLTSFAIGAREVSNAEYERFLEALSEVDRRRFRPADVPRDVRPDAPVTAVSWEGARAYARWLSTTTGLRWTLPSEAQWEYAARSAMSTGKIWDWTADCFDGRFYLHAPTDDPRVIDDACRTPVVRGGPTKALPRGSVVFRSDFFANGHPTIGFRVARPLDARRDAARINSGAPPPAPLRSPHRIVNGDRVLVITLSPPASALPVSVVAVIDFGETTQTIPLAFRGATRILGLPAGPVRVLFTTPVADGGQERTVDLPASGVARIRLSGSQLVPVRPLAPLHGVLRSANGRPLGGADVVYEAYPQRVETRTAPDGSFVIATASLYDAALFVDVRTPKRRTALLAVPAASERPAGAVPFIMPSEPEAQ